MYESLKILLYKIAIMSRLCLFNKTDTLLHGSLAGVEAAEAAPLPRCRAKPVGRTLFDEPYDGATVET